VRFSVISCLAREILCNENLFYRNVRVVFWLNKWQGLYVCVSFHNRVYDYSNPSKSQDKNSHKNPGPDIGGVGFNCSL
jgi:hypothetical protein